MKRKLYLQATGVAITLLCLVQSTFAIKIVVPDQYKEQVEAAKVAERADRARELEGVQEDDSGSIETGGQSAPETTTEGAANAADDFVMQSVVEAETAAAAFEGTLGEDQGLVSGQVLDKESGAPVAGAAIIIEGTDIATVTGADGRYSLGPVRAGEYTLSFIKSGYIEANVTEYQIAGGEISVFPFALPPRPAEMSDEVYELQDFSVTAEQANQMMMNIDLQRFSATQLDIMSSEDFSRFAASDIADAVKSITGVSLSGGKFAVIRGLNDRYSVTQLNGATLPSPDPDRPAVPLDIFPTGVFEAIETRKTHSPDMPGEASGGVINLKLLTFPEERILKFSTSMGFNTESDDAWISSGRGGKLDYIGSGASDRSFEPGESDTQLVPLQPLATFNARAGAARESIRDSFWSRSSPQGASAPFDFGFSFLYGETIERKNGHRIGLLFAGNQKREARTKQMDVNTVRSTETSGADSLGENAYMVNEFGAERIVGTEEGQISLLAGIGYEFMDGVALNFHSFFTRNGTEQNAVQGFDPLESGQKWQSGGQNNDTTFDNEGGDPANAAPSDSSFAVSEYVQREMWANQLSGSFDGLEKDSGMRFDFSLLQAENEQIEPDTFDTRGRTESVRFRRETTQDSRVVTGDFTFALDQHIRSLDRGNGTKLKSGLYYEKADREYMQQQRDLRISTQGGAPPGNIQFVGEETPSPALNPGDTPGLTGSAQGIRKVEGTYLMLDTSPTDWLQVVGGARLEYTELSYEGSGSTTQSGTPLNLQLFDPNPIDQSDVIPSINVNVELPRDLKLRLAYSQTVARPTFRELQPFPVFNLATNEIEVGNPGRMEVPSVVPGAGAVLRGFDDFMGLRMAEVKNYDARIEWYPTDQSMFTFGVFYKDTGSPIERIQVRNVSSSVPVFTFINNENDAEVYGAEVEFRFNVGEAIRNQRFDFLSFGGNLTYIDAEVKRSIVETDTAFAGFLNPGDVSETRRLFDQPDYIANLYATLAFESIRGELSITANHTGKRLVGALGEQSMDIFEDALTTVNLTYKQEIPWVEGLSVRLTAKNITDPTVRRITERGDNRAQLFGESGAPISSRPLESYKNGISYSISATMEF